VGINPGRYNVFNEDGSLFKWGKESVSATVTMKNRVQIFIGDNMEPATEKHIPARIHTVNDFDAFTLSVCRTALVKYVALLTEKLRMYQEAYQLIIQQKNQDFSAMVLKLIPAWRWIEKTQELNELQEICENLLMDTMGNLYNIAPNTFTSEFIIVFTEA
jgi:ASC-1-like (ASCH) protein